jgi:hypothetical protein
MTTFNQEIRDPASIIFKDFLYLPKSLANSTDMVDKTCKFVTAIIEATHPVTQSFKDTTCIFSTLGFISTLKPMFPIGEFRKTTANLKIASKVSLLGAQFLEMAKGLDTLKLISLGNISNTIGRYPLFARVIKVSPPLNIAKDTLVVFSTLCSLKLNFVENSKLRNMDVKEINLSPVARKLHADEVYTNRIAIISDIFKLAIVGLMLGLALIGALGGTLALSTALITTSYGTLTLGILANGIGLLTASAALLKSLHTYAATQK